MTKYCFLDVETSGLDPKENGILQIGCILEVGGFEKEFSLKSKPFDSDVIEDGALKVTGFTREEIADWPSPQVTYNMLIEEFSKFVDKYDKQDKFMFVGYNAAFDERFVREFFLKNGNKFFGSYFHFPYIDVMTLAAHILIKKRHQMKDFKLMTVASEFGIKINITDAHDALYDIKITREIYKRISNDFHGE